MHKVNHPSTKHYCENVWDVDPVKVCKGHPVGLAWFSPDCKHFSKAKGGKPKDKNIRGLAWVALRWAGLVRPRVMKIKEKNKRVLPEVVKKALTEILMIKTDEYEKVRTEQQTLEKEIEAIRKYMEESE